MMTLKREKERLTAQTQKKKKTLINVHDRIMDQLADIMFSAHNYPHYAAQRVISRLKTKQPALSIWVNRIMFIAKVVHPTRAPSLHEILNDSLEGTRVIMIV